PGNGRASLLLALLVFFAARRARAFARPCLFVFPMVSSDSNLTLEGEEKHKQLIDSGSHKELCLFSSSNSPYRVPRLPSTRGTHRAPLPSSFEMPPLRARDSHVAFS